MGKLFSDKKVLYSKEAVLELIEFCNKAKINEIYLQLYRAGWAYYNSKITDRTKYKEIVQATGFWLTGYIFFWPKEIKL